jgi:hypothetical protein
MYNRDITNNERKNKMIDKLLRENNGIKDVMINWLIMLMILCPLGAVGMLGFFWISFKILGAI